MPKRDPASPMKVLPLSQRIERAIGMLQMIPKGKQDTWSAFFACCALGTPISVSAS